MGGFLWVVGPSGFRSTSWQTDVRFPLAVLAMLAGPSTVLWGLWHFLQGLFISGTYAGELSLPLFVSMNFFGAVVQLTAYRVLLVWIYDRTGSLLLVTFMHASLTTSTIFIFTPLATGASFLIYVWTLAAAFWVVVAALALAYGGHFSGRSLRTRTA